MIEFDRSLQPILRPGRDSTTESGVGVTQPGGPGLGFDLPTTNPLRAQVTALENQVEQLEQRNAELQADVSTLQQQLSTKKNQLQDANAAFDDLLQRAREAVQAAYDQGVQDVLDYLRNNGII